MDETTELPIELVWIGADPPLRVFLRMPADSRVAQAIAASGIMAQIRESAPAPPQRDPLDGVSIAVFGRPARPDDPLHAYDRIELLPPLKVDPKVARQRRADHRRRLAGERRWAPDRQTPRG
jgi:putative ubiquitin-RnfH superfamily antitoxin RatB of RatAB toxin-antitoxin module